MALGDVAKAKDVQGAALVGVIDNALVYMRENGILITGKRVAAIDLVRLLETAYGGWKVAENPTAITLERGIFEGSLPLTLHSVRYFIEGMIKGYSRPVIHASYTPPSAPVVVSSGGASITSY